MVILSLSYLYDRLNFLILLLVHAVSRHTRLFSSMLAPISFHIHLSSFMPASQHPASL
jgi:hypothetical protein